MSPTTLDAFLTIGTVVLGAFALTVSVLSLLDTMRRTKKPQSQPRAH